MNLLEHQAKSLLAEHSLPVPSAQLYKKSDASLPTFGLPCVLKSQVPVGGRGKAGGVVIVHSEPEFSSALSALFNLEIKGYVPQAILAETLLDIQHEYYLALKLNRDTRQVEWLVSQAGGVDVEESAKGMSVAVQGTPDAYSAVAQALSLDVHLLEPVMRGCEQAFFASDLLLCEINPLVKTTDEKLICADAKITVDDNARFRHPELPWPTETGNQPKPLGGTIGCIANGAGMAMSTMDTIVAAGGRPANFLDIGGGTGEKEFVTALGQVKDLPGVTSIIINIFAGISRCDEIAHGIIAAREHISDLPPLFIRLEGTNRDEAMELLKNAGISTEPDLKTCVQKAMEAHS